jgi:hypothetical protein
MPTLTVTPAPSPEPSQGRSGAEHSRSATSAPPSKFPSLEEQKLAHQAFSRLGVELEPIGKEDLLRVKALGYDGGLNVVDATNGQPLQAGDILVGLLAWPTTNLSELADILNREDIFELHPLKFYVVRSEPTMVFDEQNASTKQRKMADKVVTGRIGVKNLFPTPKRREAQPAPAAAFSDPLPATNAKPARATPTNALPANKPAATTIEYRDLAPTNEQRVLHDNPYSSQPTIAATDPYAPPQSRQVAAGPQLFEFPGTAPQADRTVVAYDVPSNLRKDIEKYAGFADIEFIFDQKGRCLVQGSSEQQEQFKRLLDSTAKWRESISTRDDSVKPVEMVTEKGETSLHWRAAGLVLATLPNVSTVLVKEVVPGSPAAWLDIRAGDALTRIERFSVSSLPEAESILSTLIAGFSDGNKQVQAYFARRQERRSPAYIWKTLPLNPGVETSNGDGGLAPPK